MVRGFCVSCSIPHISTHHSSQSLPFLTRLFLPLLSPSPLSSVSSPSPLPHPYLLTFPTTPLFPPLIYPILPQFCVLSSYPLFVSQFVFPFSPLSTLSDMLFHISTNSTLHTPLHCILLLMLHLSSITRQPHEDK